MFLILKKKLLFIFILLITVNSYSRNFGDNNDIPLVDEICKNVDKNYKTKSYNSVDSFFKSINHKFSKDENTNSSTELYHLLVENDLSNINNYKEGRFLIIFNKFIFNNKIFVILAIWLAIIIFFICGKCQFNQNDPTKYKKLNLLNKFHFPITLLIFIGTFLLSICSYYKSEKLYLNLNANICSIIRFFEEIKFGKGKYNHEKEFPEEYKWPGLLDLTYIILETSSIINKIKEEKEEIFNSVEKMQVNISEYKDLITLFPKELKKSKLLNFTINKKKIRPLYLSQYDDINKNNSTINNIYLDYINQIEYCLNELNKLKITTLKMAKKDEPYKNIMKKIFERINNETFPIRDANITNNLIIIHEIFIKRLYKFDRAVFLFGFIISLVILFFLLLSNYFWKSLIKIFLYFLWNLGMAMIVLSEILSDFFIKTSFYHSNFMDLIYTDILNVNKGSILNNCLNEDGNLNIFWSLEEKECLESLNELYHSFGNHLKSLPPLIASYTIKTELKYIEQYLLDISLTTDESYEKNDISYVLESLKNMTGHKWVSDKNKCGENHYLPKKELSQEGVIINERTCFSINDLFTEKELNKLYGDKTKNIYDIIKTTIEELTNYFQQNEKLLTEIRDNFSFFEKNYILLIYEMNKIREKARNLVEQYTNIYKSMINQNETIFSLFNCGNLKNGFITCYDLNYNYVSGLWKLIGIFNLINFIFFILGVFLLKLFIIKKNQSENVKMMEQQKDSSLEEEELDEIPEEADDEQENYE